MLNTENAKPKKNNLVSGLMGAGVNILTGGLGGALGGLMDRALNGSPYDQQKKLQELQIKGAKELSDYQQKQAMQMWNDTNFDAQRAQMEKAGLSPSLMYGGVGAGGGTTQGAGGGGMPSGDSASAQMMAKLQAQSMGADIALKMAQANNIKADTENKTFDNEVRATVGSAEYSEQIKAELNKERVQNVTDYRKAVAIMDALGGTDPEKMYALDKFGNYDNTEFSKLGKQQTKFMMEEYTELEARINKLNQDIKASKQGVNESKANEELLKIETKIRDFKGDLSELGLNETTVKIVELLLKAMIGGR